MSAAALLGALPLGGCPDDAGGGCRDYVPPASFDPSTPPVSFRTHVMPLFVRSCQFSTCHGSPSSSNGVYLGSSGEDPTTIHQGIVDVRASRLQTMAYVKPGDPRESFLMRKMDGSHCLLDDQCTEKSCGQSMPRDEETLSLDERNVVRRWIAQGAKDD